MNEELMEIMKKRWADRKNQTWVFYNEQTKFFDLFFNAGVINAGLAMIFIPL